MATKRATKRVTRVPRRQPVQKGVRGITPDIREAIRDEAERRGLSMNDVLLDILGRRFKMKIERSPRAPRLPDHVTDHESITIRMPLELRNAIRHESIDLGVSDEALILQTIIDAL